VFYHEQDAISLDEDGMLTAPLRLCWSGNAQEIVDALRGEGLAVEWDGRDDHRIAVLPGTSTEDEDDEEEGDEDDDTRIKVFDSFEESRAYMNDQYARADRAVEPWQARLQPGDCYVACDDELIIYGEIIAAEPGDMPLKENSRYVRAFSDYVPDGEYGVIHVASAAGPLSRDAFERARSLGWPSDKAAFRRVVVSEPGWQALTS